MEQFKKWYRILLILLPISLIGVIGLKTNEKITIETTNYAVAIEQLRKEESVEIELYGEGFKQGDFVFVEGEKVPTEVVYNKMLTFKLPKKYLQDKKVRLKVQRLAASGMPKESSNAYMIYND